MSTKAMLDHDENCAMWRGDDSAECTCRKRYVPVLDDDGHPTGYYKDRSTGEIVTLDDEYDIADYQEETT